ncbi:MAG: aminotransferase class IV [Methylocella sp.]
MLWLDGAVYPDNRAPFDLSDRGLLLGDGVFDTALVLNGRVFRAEAHFQRLIDALAFLDIDADPKAIHAAAAALLPHAERHALRITLTRGPGLRGLAPTGAQRPTVMASLSPLPPRFFWPRLSMDVATVRRNETSPLSRIKALSYLDAILAMREAAGKGCDDVLFLNGADHVACAAVGNVFALFGDELVTPPLSDGVLPGIIRGFLLEECGKLGLAARERSLDLKEFCTADAAFMTNSLRLIAPVERVGAAVIGEKGGGIVEALQRHLRQAIAAECGIEP